MTFPLFDTLRSAASSGPVIIVNHAALRSDILILLHNAYPSLIPTPNDFYNRARELKDKLLISRVKDGLDSREYDKNTCLIARRALRARWKALSMQWVQSLRTTVSYNTSWISTYVPIPHRYPLSSNPVIAILAPDLRAAHRYFLWRKLTHLFQLLEARLR